MGNDTSEVSRTRYDIGKFSMFRNDIQTIYQLSLQNRPDLLHEQRENGHTNGRT